MSGLRDKADATSLKHKFSVPVGVNGWFTSWLIVLEKETYHKDAHMAVSTLFEAELG